jgi:NADH dehydrogenase
VSTQNNRTRICVLGGTGFVGRHIVNRFAERGFYVKVLSRNPARHRDLLVLPTVELINADVHDPAILRREFASVDGVINLVGILNESGHSGRGFEHVHSELTAKVLDACRSTHVTRLLHMSALNADAERGPSHYLRTKGEAENLVQAQAGEVFRATIFQPAVIFGPGDSFINRFAKLVKLTPGVFPLACAGARFAPAYVGDVADAFVQSYAEHDTFGQSYDLCGPRVYTLKEIIEYIARLLQRRCIVIDLPDWAARMQANTLEFAPGKPFSRDNYQSLKIDSVCSRNGFAAFGIEPTALETVAPSYLGSARRAD